MKYSLQFIFSLFLLTSFGVKAFAVLTSAPRAQRPLEFDGEKIVNNPQKCMNFDAEIKNNTIYKNVLAKIPTKDQQLYRKVQESLAEARDVFEACRSVKRDQSFSPATLQTMAQTIQKVNIVRGIASTKKNIGARVKLQQCILASQKIGVPDYAACMTSEQGRKYTTNRPYQWITKKYEKKDKHGNVISVSEKKVATTVSAKPCITPTYNEYITELYNEGMKCFEKEGVDIESIFGMTYQESKFNHNARSSTKVTGFKQVTSIARRAVQNDWATWEEMQKKHPECNTPSINAALNSDDKPENKEDLDSCSTIEMPENPLKNMIYGMLYFLQDRKRAEAAVERAKDILHLPDEAKFDEKIIRDLARYSYNGGYGTALAIFYKYIRNWNFIYSGKAAQACWKKEKEYQLEVKARKERYKPREDCEAVRNQAVKPPSYEIFSKEFPPFVRAVYGNETLSGAQNIGDQKLVNRIYAKKRELSGYVRSIKSAAATLENLYGIDCSDLETY